MSTSAENITPAVQRSLSYVTATDVGLRREENQDSLAVLIGDHGSTFVVADGMGGVRGGAIASQLAVETFTAKIGPEKSLREEILRKAVREANRAVFEKGSADPTLSGMGTTMVCLSFVGEQLFVTNVGDSRAYRIRAGRARKLTQDHTLVMELVRTGAISEDQAESHPVSHMLTRSLGPSPAVDVDCWIYEYGPARGDYYVLCSDGLYNLVSEQEIARVISDTALENVGKELVSLANSRGGSDNITVIVVRVDESYPKGPEEYPDPAGESLEPPTLELEERVVTEALGQIQGQSNGHSAPESPQLKPEVSIQGLQQAHSEQSAANAQGPAAVDESRKITEALNRSELAHPSAHWWKWILAALVLVTVISLVRNDRQLNPVSNNSSLSPEELAAKQQSLSGAGVKIAPETQSFGTVGVDPELSAISDQRELPTVDEGQALQIKREMLQSRLIRTEENLKLIDSPPSEKIAEVLKAAAADRQKLAKQVEAVRAELEEATRDLARWYGRRKRLQSEDPLKLAGELAATVPAVQQKKDAFGSATWSYLEAAGQLRINPTDPSLEKKVNELGEVRKNKLHDVAEAVRSAIDDGVLTSHQRIADRTIERDKLEHALGGVDEDIAFFKVLTSSDVSARQDKRKELERNRERLQKEIAETER